MTTRQFNCFTCSQPMFMPITVRPPFNMSCPMCGAVHAATGNGVNLTRPGKVFARLSAWYDYPEYKPYRVGPYRVRYSNGNIGTSLVSWNGEHWHNGPVLFHTGSVIAWQGLGGEMEHLKTMPYEHAAPIQLLTEDDSECD